MQNFLGLKHLIYKKSTWLKMRLAAGFSFINNYIFKLGFLDGHAGYVCAKMTAHYTFLKYARLRELNNAAKETKETGSTWGE